MYKRALKDRMDVQKTSGEFLIPHGMPHEHFPAIVWSLSLWLEI